jgi:hypothetical protein
MRTFAATLLGLLLVSRPSLADGIPTPEALYQQQKKRVALAVTLEALCPIAGAGPFTREKTTRRRCWPSLTPSARERRSVPPSKSSISTTKAPAGSIVFGLTSGCA